MKRHSDITTAAAYFIIKDVMPVSTAENVGLKRLVKVTDPR